MNTSNGPKSDPQVIAWLGRQFGSVHTTAGPSDDLTKDEHGLEFSGLREVM
jgi:hypothetical protein